MRVEEFPPNLIREVAGYQLDGGKVNSISVNPKDRNHIIIVTEYGGLWKTENGGINWYHLDNLPTVKANDVEYADNGSTVIATLERDNLVENGGGIWVSRDGGTNWSKPSTANPPKHERIPDRIGAYGISYAPDKPGTVYVGTDYGVATSKDYGENWSHEMMKVTSRILINKKQNSVYSILALHDGRAIACCSVFAFMKSGSSWWMLPYSTSGEGDAPPLKNAEIWPSDKDKVLTITNGFFELYEIASNKQRGISLPTHSTLRFIRILKSVRKSSFDIVIGTSMGLLRATCKDIEELKKLKAEDWTAYGKSLGIYGDCGYLEVDNNRDPILFGSSAGLFKPETPEGFFWIPAATHESGLNSYKITDLAGTNLPLSGGKYITYLYFTTEDNGMWASLDNGTSWPHFLNKLGFFLQVVKDAKSDSEITVAYGSKELGLTKSVFSSPNFSKEDYIPSIDKTGNELAPMSEVYLISPNNWIRYRLPVLNFSPEVYTSQNNGKHWGEKASVELERINGFYISADTEGPKAYAAFRSSTLRPDGEPIFGIIRISDVLSPDVITYGNKDLKYFPDNGSLGVRYTGEQSKVIFGVNPKNPLHIIAPDIYNQVVMVSKNGGDKWEPDSNLTREIIKGRFLLYDGDTFHMQVTEIAFDPYNDSRILVGTRDSGIIITTNGGITWSTVPNSEQITYITGFFFTHKNTVIVSSYGRGLWQVDLTFGHSFPFDIYCRRGDCKIRLPFDPHPPIYEKDRWIHDDIIVFLNGRINGLLLEQNEVKKITITEGTTHKRFPGKSRNPRKINVIESSNGIGFNGLEGCLAAIQDGEIIKGITLKENKIFGIISGKEEFKEA